MAIHHFTQPEWTLYEVEQSGLLFSTDKNKLNVAYVQQFLSSTYWATDRSIEQVGESIRHSLCYGVYEQNKQIGFARAVTDYVVCALLCDVFVDEIYRGRGIGKVLLNIILKSPVTAKVDRWSLATHDAEKLYEKFGFKQNTRLMSRVTHAGILAS